MVMLVLVQRQLRTSKPILFAPPNATIALHGHRETFSPGSTRWLTLITNVTYHPHSCEDSCTGGIRLVR